MSEHPFKLTFKLKQHTPMIHFQHDQDGATIRATELKPKLDKFIIEREFKSRDMYKHLLVGYDEQTKKATDKDALNYKVKINSQNIRTEEIKKKKGGTDEVEQFPLFFSDVLSKGDDIKKFRYTDSTIELEFFSIKSELLEIIKKNINSFFNNHNFGTRNYKGFGSFSLDKNDPCYKSLKLPYCFEFDININNNKREYFKQIFSKIELFYKTLRSGINDYNGKNTDFYFKSMLFLYAKSEDIQWDKKSIKEKFFNLQVDKQLGEHENSEILRYASKKKYLIKELLGLSSEEAWSSYGTKITRENNEIARFASPIFFKPKIEGNKCKVFFICKSINSDMFDKVFTIKSSKDNNKELQLSTPSQGIFSPRKFIEYVINKVDLKDHVEKRFHKHNKFSEINKIYESLKKNFKEQEMKNKEKKGGGNV